MKKIIALLSLSLILVFIGGFKKNNTKFNYKYFVYANSNSAGDLLYLYQAKEYLINAYEVLILSLDESAHEQAVKDNLTKLTNISNAEVLYQAGSIKIVIGSGKGQSLSGDLKSSACGGTINKKVFIIDWLLGW